MGKLSRLAFLFFVLVLSVAGTGKGPHANLIPSTFQGIEDENSSVCFSENKLNDYGLHNAYEHVVSQVNSFPSPDSKNQSNTCRPGTCSVESRIQSVALEYLIYSKNIHPGLSIGDIIFPFHYFW